GVGAALRGGPRCRASQEQVMHPRRVWFPLTLLALALGVSSSARPPADTDPAALLDRAKQALAPLEGDVRLPGLKESVEVVRDRRGVPHLRAKLAHDLLFAPRL